MVDFTDVEFVSRYDVLGPPNGCKGDCEGTGFIPCREGSREDEPPVYRVLWYLAEAKHPTDDGWHFIPCPQCKADDPLVKLAWAFMGRSSPPSGDQV